MTTRCPFGAPTGRAAPHACRCSSSRTWRPRIHPKRRLHLVTDGIESALEQARAAADGKTIAMGGASVGRQFIEAGLVDELQIHLAPVLFGAGVSMFAGLEDRHIELEPIEAIHTDTAIHLRFKVTRD